MKNTNVINHSVEIPETYANKRLDQALAALLPDYSRTQLQSWIQAKMVLVENQPVSTKMKVSGGEIVTIAATLKPQPTAWIAQNIDLNIVHEDPAIIVINKPANLVVHPGAGNSDQTLLNALLHHCPDLQNLPRAGILHRLDKATTGLLVIAKTTSALMALNEELQAKTMVREYQAIVTGTMISGGKVDAPINRHPIERKRMAVCANGKPAVTHYRIAEKYRYHTRLKLQLETGRTHQIRVHMAHIKHPIVGDPVYGGRLRLGKGMSQELIEQLRQFDRQALHAYALSFIHPLSLEPVRYEIDLPEDMQALIAALQNDTRIQSN
jgi:23S rRNA pseudouridine1911/1915/1917 synthase